ncbi:hypothetical protein VNO77_03583 [Canavalia gladiata]|uniref:Uncharacterized protein n=1 Tax=Canavalia gladiata TaxID=3824 RepID=A0AAN9MUZ8_CANGL
MQTRRRPCTTAFITGSGCGTTALHCSVLIGVLDFQFLTTNATRGKDPIEGLVMSGERRSECIECSLLERMFCMRCVCLQQHLATRRQEIPRQTVFSPTSIVGIGNSPNVLAQGFSTWAPL